MVMIVQYKRRAHWCCRESPRYKERVIPDISQPRLPLGSESMGEGGVALTSRES